MTGTRTSRIACILAPNSHSTMRITCLSLLSVPDGMLGKIPVGTSSSGSKLEVVVSQMARKKKFCINIGIPVTKFVTVVQRLVYSKMSSVVFIKYLRALVKGHVPRDSVSRECIAVARSGTGGTLSNCRSIGRSISRKLCERGDDSVALSHRLSRYSRRRDGSPTSCARYPAGIASTRC